MNNFNLTHIWREKSNGDVADEIATDSGAEDADDVEENGSVGDKSSECKFLSKSARKHLRRKACKA